MKSERCIPGWRRLSRAPLSCRAIIRTAVVLPVLFAVMFGGFGCDQEEEIPRYRIDDVVVTVEDRDDYSSQTDVKLVLMDTDTNRLVAGPVLTDEYGVYVFRDLPDGHYQVLAVPDGGRGLYHLPGPFTVPAKGWQVVPKAASGGGRLMAPQTPPAEMIMVRVTTYESLEFADDLPRISGQVVDAASGEPLAEAFVGLPANSIYLPAYLGIMTVSEDITDTEGRFHVAKIPFSVDPVSGDAFQLLPLIVTKEGFTPEVWFYNPPQGDDNLDITNAVIELSVPSTAPTGGVTGRVEFLGQGVADVPVAISYLAGPDLAIEAVLRGTNDKASGPAGSLESPGPAERPDRAQSQTMVGMPGFVVRTEAGGHFRFDSLWAGWYMVQPGYQADDGYTPLGGVVDYTLLVTETNLTQIGALPAVKTIAPNSPPAGQRWVDARPTFRWTAVTEADSYTVFLDRGVLGTTAQTELALPEEVELQAGSYHVWFVTGFRQDGVEVGKMDRLVRFRTRSATTP